MAGKVSNGVDFDPSTLMDTQSQEVTETQAEPSDQVVDTPEVTQETVEAIQEPDVAVVKGELENYKNRYSNLEKLLGKQSSELGELRKFYQQFQEQQKQKTEEPDAEYIDQFVKNPKQAIQQEIARREADVQQKRIQENEFVTANVNRVYQAIPEFDNLRNTILEIAKNEDGIANADMNMLEETLRSDPLFAIQYAKRAQLKQQLESVKNNGKKVVDQLSNNSKRPVPVKAGAPTVSKNSLSTDDIAALSDAELNKLKKQYGLI